MKRISLLFIGLFFIFVNIGKGFSAECPEYMTEPPVLVGAEVKGSVILNNDTGIYTYSYILINGKDSTGCIWWFEIDITYPRGGISLPTEGLVDYSKHVEKGVLSDPDTQKMIPVAFPNVPKMLNYTGAWGAGLTVDGEAHWSSNMDIFRLPPGSRLEGFTMTTYGLPAIRQVKIEPRYDPPPFEEGEDTLEAIEKLTQTREAITVKGKTIGPTAPPKAFIPIDFLETIRNYIDESVTLGWLIDSTLVTTLKTELNTARSFIEANDPSQAKTTLRQFMSKIEQASSTQRTSEAYGLLYFNAKYLVEQLPDTYIPPPPPVLELKPEETTLPIGTTYTLTATYTVGNTPVEWPNCPVNLEVKEGPNAGLLLEEFPVGGVEPVSFNYTSIKVGTDHLEAQIKELPDGCVGVTSLPVQVTWTGGPDLVIKLFIPPLIKSEGGKPIFITEITGNQGSTSAGTSITRYFLSEDEIINPNQDRPIGERNIPSLNAGEESDGGTKEFILPNDIPAGTYYLGACADAEQSVVELDEQNNCEINKLAIVVPVETPSNQLPDCTRATPNIKTLWPPNHKLVTISINGVTDPDGDPVTITIARITQDEPVNGLGDGDTSPDGFGVGTSEAQIRAERSGTGNGRVYAISFKAEDGKGGSCTNTVHVGVPHDQGKGKTPVDDGQNYDSTQP